MDHRVVLWSSPRVSLQPGPLQTLVSVSVATLFDANVYLRVNRLVHSCPHAFAFLNLCPITSTFQCLQSEQLVFLCFVA